MIAGGVWGTDLDTIGMSLLQQVDATLTGTGVRAAQVEAPSSTGTPPPFEVNPSTVGQPVGLFTYYSSLGSSTGYPNSVGAESGHAEVVGNHYYGIGYGVATNVIHVDNYEANYFYNSLVAANLAIPGRVANQSFAFNGELSTVDQAYDNYAASRNTVFASGMGNGTPIASPATCYNGMGVGVYGAASTTGPTTDGRCKPDITAPGGATSFSTPYVSGSAAVLVQAAARGDGGANVTAASDLRTVKGLLMNGAVKPSDWTNGVATPLDARYGAGILNVFNSWKQLGGGQHSFIESTSNTSGSPHPPGTNTGNEPVLRGWDYNTIANTGTSGNYKEQVNHYYFNLNTNTGDTLTLTTTLVWNRQNGRSTINDLNLFLYNTSNGSLVTCSTSRVDNVEHMYVKALPKGRYDLQVQKNATSVVTASETYALAFEFFNMQLSLARTNNGNIRVAWPITPAGFNLQSATNLSSAAWSPVTATVSVVNGQNVVVLPAGSGRQFLRLQRP